MTSKTIWFFYLAVERSVAALRLLSGWCWWPLASERLSRAWLLLLRLPPRVYFRKINHSKWLKTCNLRKIAKISDYLNTLRFGCCRAVCVAELNIAVNWVWPFGWKFLVPFGFVPCETIESFISSKIIARELLDGIKLMWNQKIRPAGPPRAVWENRLSRRHAMHFYYSKCATNRAEDGRITFSRAWRWAVLRRMDWPSSFLPRPVPVFFSSSCFTASTPPIVNN